MSLARKCNRCGKLYEYYPSGKKMQYNAVRRVAMSGGYSIREQDSVLDLCEDCMSSFNLWMAEGKKKETKENPGDTEATRSITDRTVYTDYKHEAWVAALNILATEYYVKTNQPDKYSYYCDILNSLDDTQLECLHVWLSLNTHITSLGHMMSHNDYEHVKENLFDFLEEVEND